MSDDRYGQTPPEAYPQPGGMAPPPPPPPPGLFPDQQTPAAPPQYAPQAAPPQYPPQAPPAYGQQPIPAQPPKKRRTGLIIGLVVGALALCGIASCIGVVAMGANAAAEQKKILGQADGHYSAAMSAVETAGTTIETAGKAGSDTQKVAAALDEAGKALRTGRDEIAAARAAAEGLDDSAGRTDYLASLTAATEALDALEDVIAYLGTASGMGSKVTEAGKAASKAADDLNGAIDAGNGSDYGAMKSKAQAAASGYALAAKLFREAAALDKSAGLDKAASFVDKQKEQADLAVKMADEGKAGKTSAYNADIKRVEELRKQAAGIGDPEIVKDPQWVEKRLADLTKKTTEAGTKADELHARAMQALQAD